MNPVAILTARSFNPPRSIDGPSTNTLAGLRDPDETWNPKRRSGNMHPIAGVRYLTVGSFDDRQINFICKASSIHTIEYTDARLVRVTSRKISVRHAALCGLRNRTHSLSTTRRHSINCRTKSWRYRVSIRTRGLIFLREGSGGVRMLTGLAWQLTIEPFRLAMRWMGLLFKPLPKLGVLPLKLSPFSKIRG